jgi:hypothetical protein
MTETRRFPPPWSVDNPDKKLGQDCYVDRDANGHALANVIERMSLGGGSGSRLSRISDRLRNSI